MTTRETHHDRQLKAERLMLRRRLQKRRRALRVGDTVRLPEAPHRATVIDMREGGSVEVAAGIVTRVYDPGVLERIPSTQDATDR